jgi:hypothetical protein
MGATPKWCFSWDSQVKSFVILEIRTLAILDTHNFLCRPPIEVRFEKQVVALIESFPKIYGITLAHV